MPELSESNASEAQGTTNNKKRPSTPPLEPDPKKKFFKFSRGKGVVTVNNNIKVQVDHGKMTLIEKQKKKQMPKKIDFDMSDLTVEDTNLPNVNSILSLLEDDNSDASSKNNGSKIILQAHSSVSASENSILLHPQPVPPAANLILSPISQMCDVTSGLALNSPKRVRNLTSVLNEISSESSRNTDEGKTSESSTPSDVKRRRAKRSFAQQKNLKTWKKSQMLLDAGQKRFGVTQCTECSILYHIGDPSDEAMHSNYHNSRNVLKFVGWKNERIVANFGSNGRIIQILPGDSKIWWRKVMDLMEVINRELGCFDMEFKLDDCQAFLYIKSRSIAGCIVAVPKTEGHRMLTTKQNEADMCSEMKYQIKCGIPRIWVAHSHRKQGVGRALMNAVKNNFMSDYILQNDDIALSPPTEMGKNFAKSYFKTPNYLIYYV
ncbi:hypothetical protein NQ315_009486 [Exocentrus adspersus]|uniref:N-acetyltransferase ESCO2 n=1 Tax=Exocentrus adspersus TaxID=1586481 RepID=A0AAV8WHB7_9CUCU|nr:hypothetical protein NQ315_009486 [Exocentrus adspersus]